MRRRFFWKYNRTPHRGFHRDMNKSSTAIVLGGSIGGLLMARALSSHFTEVKIIERDALPPGPLLRKGTPQCHHAHGLLASGYRIMDDYFPGMMDELASQGAPRGDVVGDFIWYQYGSWKLRFDSGLQGITVSRPCLESQLRQHVLALPNVRLLQNVESLEPSFDTQSQRVTGVRIRHFADDRHEELAAALVVDATGRGSNAIACLKKWGFATPEAVEVRVNVGYATRVFERLPGDFKDSMGGIISSSPPQGTRYGAVLAAEGNRWVVTLAGVTGDYPPVDEAPWLAFAASLPVSDVYDLAIRAKPIGEIKSYRFPANTRFYYEKLKAFPDGFIVTGDAICSFNPIYGQGMSVAASEAKALDECLQESTTSLAKRFYARAAKIIDIPWMIATGEDLRYPDVVGKRAPGSRLINRYLESVHHVAGIDETVCRKFFDVLSLLASPMSLLKPAFMWHVWKRRRALS